jgi:AcrR family transcriptional regulator
MTAAEHPSSTEPDLPTRRRRARRGEGARLREEILDATEQLLLRTGSVDAVSIRAVADAVGVTPPSIYRHFPDKDTLVFEVCNRYFSALEEEIERAVTGIDDPVEAVVAGARTYVEFGRQNPEPYRIVFMLRPELMPAEARESWPMGATPFQLLVGIVQACIDAGRLRPELDDAFPVALTIWAQAHGVTALMVSKPFLPIDDQFVEAYLQSCLCGIVAD